MPWKTVRSLLKHILRANAQSLSLYETAITPSCGGNRIIREHYESHAGGHKGVTKTYLFIKKRYIWNNI